MIVVINPSGSSGHSFKGLHAYCAHDAGGSASAERVDWIETRNLAVDDASQGWRIMAATALAQNGLKAAAGVASTGRKSDAHVMHVVLSFHTGEPLTREEMAAAADELLAHLGLDPAKSRAKSKAGRRQFADEHQAIYYAHNDTESRHLHIMLNRVHPEHGVMLPSNNDQIKASKWAQAYSERFGTEHTTPDRQINNAARDRGEYVKGKRRSLKRAFEQEREAKASNDNDVVEGVKAAEAKKDAALALKGRNMEAMHAQGWTSLAEAHKTRRAAIGQQTQREINKTRASVRDAFRPQWTDLDRRQKGERQTFEALEKSLFGRAKNFVHTLSRSRAVEGEEPKGLLSRTFRILVSATERKSYFERAQEAQRKALQREQDARAQAAVDALNKAKSDKLEANRAQFAKDRADLKARQHAQRSAYGKQWRERNAERDLAFENAKTKAVQRDALLDAHKDATKDGLTDRRLKRLKELDDRRSAFRDTAQDRTDSFENERDAEYDRDSTDD